RGGRPIRPVLNGTVVGTGVIGRECVSIDVSYAGDPLDARYLRVAFGPYQKHRLRGDSIGQGGSSDRPPFVALPRGDRPLEYLLAHGRDLRHGARAARRQSSAIPVATLGVARALDAYDTSALARFHRDFYTTPWRGGDPFEDLARSPVWPKLPECVTDPLRAPNDRLLQP